MKKTLLSALTIAAMMVMVACGVSSKAVADKQVAVIESFTLKIDSVANNGELSTLVGSFQDELTAISTNEENKDVKLDAEDEKRIQEASMKFAAKMQEVSAKFAAEEAAAAQVAAEAAAAAEAEAAKTKKK